MRDTPGLVKIVVHGIHAEGAEVDPTGNGIHVGTIHIDEPAIFVHPCGHIAKIELKHPRGVRIGNHHASHPPPIAGQQLTDMRDIHLPIGSSLNLHHPGPHLTALLHGFKPSHGGGCRIGAMG